MNAIEKAQGPCVILAGAGTGKTHTIVEKVKFLVERNIYKPEKIVCITFSNEAANSLAARIQKAMSKGNEVIVRTFHGFSSDLLRKYGKKIGINQEFKILDPDDAKVILHSNLKVPAGNCTRYVNSISQAKDLGIKVEELEEYYEKESLKYNGTNLEKRLESLQFEFQTLHIKKENQKKKELGLEIKNLSGLIRIKKFISAWRAYEKLKKIRNYQDYSDLNNNALYLLETFPEIAENYDYIIVDEFQDTNKVQLELLKRLAAKKNITVVGDLNQSIYRFRGAYNKNFEEFRDYFNVLEKDIFNLAKSFRSTNVILNAAHNIIVNNYQNREECFFVENVHGKKGDKIEVYELKNSKEEARKVVELVKREMEKGTSPEEICVMFRNHQYGRIIRQALDFENIEYCAVSKSSLLKQKSVKTVISYLEILEKLKSKSKGGEKAWWELIYHSNFSTEDLVFLGKFIKEKRKEECLSVVMLNKLEKLDLSEEGKTASKMLTNRIKLMIPSLSKELPEMIKDIFNFAGLVNSGETKEEKETTLNLNKFYELAVNHSSLHESDIFTFVHYLNVLNDLKIEIEAAKIEEKGVRLMTLHATKGLEFNTVILTNMAQGRFPIEKISNNSLLPMVLFPEFRGMNIKTEDIDYYVSERQRKNQLFEERRLCYVAFTRAREKLVLTYSKEYGGKRSYPSQFLNEVKYKENPDFVFEIDDKEKYSVKKAEIKNSSSIENFSTKNFDIFIEKVAHDSQRERENIIKSPKNMHFSPTSLLLFDECQKKYEYKYIYNMPEEKVMNWEAILLGSFVHTVLERGVKEGFRSLKDFLTLASELHMDEEWESVDIDEANHMIKVFFERNKNKYNENSKTEQELKTVIDGLTFVGYADRIDFNKDGLEIIDYKTGKAPIKPKSRNWQLGYYALAASKFGKVKKITLEMLRQEKPLEFVLDKNGNAKAVYSNRMEFNIYDVKKEMVETARKILECYRKGFKPCPIEKNCEFCNEWVYGA